MADAPFCRWCGLARERCDEACAGAGGGGAEAVDPRFCPVCGRRLTRYVTPGHFVTRCRDHGEV